MNLTKGFPLNLRKNLPEFVYSDELIGPISIFFASKFPIEHYEIAPGRYRILTSVDNDREEIKLSAEFEIKMNVMRILFITILCVLLVGCANKSRQQAAGNARFPQAILFITYQTSIQSILEA